MEEKTEIINTQLASGAVLRVQATMLGGDEGPTEDTSPLLKFKMGQVRPGMSGAPLCNERTGAVCGVVKRSRDRESDLVQEYFASLDVQSAPILLREHAQGR